MDETGFKLCFARNSRVVAPLDFPLNGQSQPMSAEHITVVACVGVENQTVPSLVIYKGQSVLENWVGTNHTGVQATTTHSGWSNDHIARQWLEKIFDPATKPSNPSETRLLVLDGAGSHVTVAFLDLCMARNICLLFLPAHLSHRYQPLDVTVFNQLKSKYHAKMNDFMLSTKNQSQIKKGMFWGWHKEAWDACMASERIVRAGWQKSGLWPLRRDIMCPDSAPVGSIQHTERPERPRTPLTDVTSRHNEFLLRQGKTTTEEVLAKTLKGNSYLTAERDIDKIEQSKNEEASRLSQKTSGAQRRAKYPRGEFFDPDYMVAHAPEINERRADEEQAREKRRQEHSTN